MKKSTYDKLSLAYDWCEKNDKSTEFVIQYLQDACGVDHACVVAFMLNRGEFEEGPK
jgi:hypothetical protein